MTYLDQESIDSRMADANKVLIFLLVAEGLIAVIFNIFIRRYYKDFEKIILKLPEEYFKDFLDMNKDEVTKKYFPDYLINDNYLYFHVTVGFVEVKLSDIKSVRQTQSIRRSIITHLAIVTLRNNKVFIVKNTTLPKHIYLLMRLTTAGVHLEQ